ncbi:MAG: WYL domain-containing protein [Ruminococcus sp.]|nr:WYL domain-containing protein [Ruminococcus sp.]
MNIDSTLYNGRPTDTRSEVEMAIYDKLDSLGIEYKRADHDHTDTMEDCLAIEKVLGAKICKNLFLCNRQQTSFYMLLMPGDKPFKTKFLTSQLNCARLSFAEADKMQEYLHTIPGSVSALELIFDTDNNIQLVIDNDLMSDEYICGHPGINTSTVRLLREDMLRYVREAKHEPTLHKAIIEKKQIQFHRVARQMNGSLYYETDANGDDKVYTVNPYRTVFSDGFYYLVCSRERSDNSTPDKISNYRIDRISDVTLIENKGIYPETSIAGASKNVDTKRYISTHRMMWGGTPETIKFICPEWAITEIVDYFGGDYEINSNEEDAETGEKMMIVKVESTQDNMLIWARRFFDFVEIISPASLRQILRDDIAKAYKKYSKSD